MTPLRIIVGLLSAAVASVGFAIMFRVRKKHLFAMGLCGMLAYGVYLLTGAYVPGEFFSNFLAAIFAAVSCELFAQFLRAPVQIYLIPVLVPLFPGGSLYYAMDHLLSRNFSGFTDSLLKTLGAALGIAGGVIVGLSFAKTVFLTIRKKKEKEDGKKGSE